MQWVSTVRTVHVRTVTGSKVNLSSAWRMGHGEVRSYSVGELLTSSLAPVTALCDRSSLCLRSAAAASACATAALMWLGPNWLQWLKSSSARACVASREWRDCMFPWVHG